MISRSIYNFFFDTEMSMRRYILRSGVVSLVPSLMAAALLAYSGLMTEENAPQFGGGEALGLFLGLVVFAPLAETLLMGVLLELLSFFIAGPLRLAFASAVIWAGLHSLVAPVWGLGVVWPFFVFSCAYLAWRRRSWLRAFWVAACIHAFQNLLPAVAIVLEAS